MDHTYFQTLRIQISSGEDPWGVLDKIYLAISAKNNEIDDMQDMIDNMQDEIEKMEDKISDLVDEISDLRVLSDEVLIPIAKIWHQNIQQEFPQFGATILDNNTTIRLQIPVKGEFIYALIELNVHNECKYKLTSCDDTHNRDMYFLLKDIIPEPTPQQSTYGYGFVYLEKAYEVFTDLIRKLESL